MKPIFVAGLGRCGSSLVMQMIHAAGVPCFGDYPAFEPEEVNTMGRKPLELLAMPMAMKILDPHHDRWPDSFDARIIWLSRNTREQAKSQIKMLQLLAGIDVPSQTWRAMARSLENDRLLCARWRRSGGSEPLYLAFEDIIRNPLPCAQLLAEHIGQGSPRVMAACVLERGVKCEPGMEIELALIGGTR